MKNRNRTIFQRLCEVIPGGVNSPVRSFKGLGVAPIVVDRGERDMIYDADGDGYIDYCGSWGALMHGHAHPQILKAAQETMAKGTTFGITTEVEEKLARKVVELVPNIEKVRFVSSGTEATMSAVRLARGFTGRKIVIKFDGNYHGHSDAFLVKAGSGVATLSSTSSSAGIPDEWVQHTASLTFNCIDETRNFLQKNGKQVAAVILEPVAGNMGVVTAKLPFVKMLREETKKVGALLIFDEVITGFRVAQGGAQALWGIKPDMTCLGKIVGGGFPVAAFGGPAEIMDFLAPLGPVYQAGTLSGNPVAMAAGLQALKLIEEQPGLYEELERKTRIITDPIDEFIKKSMKPLCLQRVGSMFTLFFGVTEVNNFEEAKKMDHDWFVRFFQYMLANGVYPPPSAYEAWFVSAVHEESNLIKTRDLILKFLRK